MDQPQACMVAADAVPRTKPSNYPEPFASRMTGREKKPLGDPFGLSQFGVNLTTLSPGAVSALHHRHSKQDEWVYVLSGEVTLCVGDESYLMRSGMCVPREWHGAPSTKQLGSRCHDHRGRQQGIWRRSKLCNGRSRCCDGFKRPVGFPAQER